MKKLLILTLLSLSIARCIMAGDLSLGSPKLSNGSASVPAASDKPWWQPAADLTAKLAGMQTKPISSSSVSQSGMFSDARITAQATAAATNNVRGAIGDVADLMPDVQRTVVEVRATAAHAVDVSANAAAAAQSAQVVSADVRAALPQMQVLADGVGQHAVQASANAVQVGGHLAVATRNGRDITKHIFSFKTAGGGVLTAVGISGAVLIYKGGMKAYYYPAKNKEDAERREKQGVKLMKFGGGIAIASLAGLGILSKL